MFVKNPQYNNMITINTTTLNSGLQDQTQGEQHERVSLFDKPIGAYEIKKKTVKITTAEAQYFPKKHPDDRSYTGPWFRLLQFKDEFGTVHRLRYTFWKDGVGQYVFNGKELRSFFAEKKVNVGDTLEFWRTQREKDCFFITIKRRSPIEEGGGGTAPTIMQPGSTSHDVNDLQQGENTTSDSVGAVDPTSATEEDQQARAITIDPLPSCGGAHNHYEPENTAMIDLSIDDDRYLAPSFTTSSIMSGQGSSLFSLPNLESFTGRFHNSNYAMEEIFNFSDFDEIDYFFNKNYEVGQMDELPNDRIHEPNIDDTVSQMNELPNNSNLMSHDEPVLHYYKLHQAKEPGLEAQLKARNCDPYTKNLVIKYVGTIMKNIFHSTTSVEDVPALDYHSEIEKYMQPLRDLCLNLPLLEGLVAPHKCNPFEEACNEDVHAAKKAHASF